MPSPLENPFRPPIPTVVDYEKEAHAIGLLLGPKAEAAYRKRHARDLSDPSASVSSGLTAEEQAQMNEKPGMTRQEKIKTQWAMFFADAKLDNADDLLGSMVIHSDGAVSLSGDLNLLHEPWDEEWDDVAPIFPTKIRVLSGAFYLPNLTKAEHLVLPEIIEGPLNLSSLTSTQHLILPHVIRSDLLLNSLESAEHLSLPVTIGGDLDLRSLTSAKYLTLPTTIGGSLNLDGLTSIEDLVLPKFIGPFNSIWFGKEYLSQADFDRLRASRPDLADQLSYT